jgi:F0F1-type ATP synthase beta subunit
VTTVNNRLHAARQRLKGGLLSMVKDDFQRHTLPDDFAERIGRIIAVRGPVVDAQFAADSEPELLDAVTLEETLSLSVIQRLPNGRVRCIALTEPSGLATGMDVKNSGSIVEAPISPRVLREAVAILVRPDVQATAMVETGIKALDVFAPLPAGGALALYGPAGAGKLVILAEILNRLSSEPEITLLNFVQTGPPEKMRPPGAEELPNASGRIETFYLPAGDSAEPGSTSVETVRDAVQGTVYMSRDMALAGLYPSIAPLVSSSRVLTEEAVGREHVDVVRGVRDVLRRAEATRQGNGSSLSPDDQDALATADRLRAYLTQPLYVAEPYTKQPGAYVPVGQAVSDCRAILSGRYNDLPVETFRFGGSLEHLLARE